jgi:serine/threonine protein phosphatase PrpC
VRYRSQYISHIGNQRSTNQDIVLSDTDLGVYILCDGMGGTEGGDIAAEIASNSALDHLKHNARIIRQIERGELPAKQLADLAQAAVSAANQAVYNYTQQNPKLRGSGTTIALLITAGDRGACAHVGDSRIYAFRRTKLFHLTKDHSLAQDLIDRGLLKTENLENFAFRHVLSRAVGLLAAVSVDTLHFDILPDDRFLIASDGISRKVANAAIEDVMSQNDLKKILEQVVAMAQRAGGDDDISAILVESDARENEKEAQQARCEEVTLKTDILTEMYLFETLDQKNILRIVNSANLVDCVPNQQIVKQGEMETSLYVILNGDFVVEVDGKKINTIGRGNHFGEMALLTNQPRSATVKATSPGRLLVISSESFQEFIKEHPYDGAKMLAALARELSKRLLRTL